MHRGFRLGPQDEGRAACGGRIFQRVARPALCRIHAGDERVAAHAAADETQAGLQGFRARLAREFEVGRLGQGRGAEGFRHNRAGGLDGVRMAFAANPNRPDPVRRNAGPPQGIARSLDAHGRRVLVPAGHRFFPDRRFVSGMGPDARDLLPRQTKARDIGAVADNAGGDARDVPFVIRLHKRPWASARVVRSAAPRPH